MSKLKKQVRDNYDKLLSGENIDDKAWLELTVLAAITNLKQDYPGHPFVTAIRAVLGTVKPEQLELDLGQGPFTSNQAE